MLELYAAAPFDGPVISFDQMGPISLKPIQGAGWRPLKLPERLRATYNRKHGIRYIFGALDVHRDRLYARMRPHRAGSDVLGFMQTIRLVYPARQKLYWIQDNLSANWTPDIRAFAANHKIELVPTPTYASYLNRIESSSRGASPNASPGEGSRAPKRDQLASVTREPTREGHHKGCNPQLRPRSPHRRTCNPDELHLDQRGQLIEPQSIDRYVHLHCRLPDQRRRHEFWLPVHGHDRLQQRLRDLAARKSVTADGGRRYIAEVLRLRRGARGRSAFLLSLREAG